MRGLPPSARPLPRIGHWRVWIEEWLPALAVLAFLGACYLATLQTIPNGSSAPFMIDVGEAQIVLNEWGSLHATGYPLYVISGNLLTTAAGWLGIGPFFAAAAVSLGWGLLALALLYWLARRLGGRRWLAAAVILLFGLTGDFWLHAVIAEIYTFTLLMLLALFSLAERRGGAIYALALLGGFAVFHHRAIATSIPALLAAVWPAWRLGMGRTRWRAGQILRQLGVCLALGALGISPYLWPYLRARAGADWVFGEPGTPRGLWDEVVGRLAARYIGLPESLPALAENFQRVNQALIDSLTLPGLLLGIAGLALALRGRQRLALPLALNALSTWLFHGLLYHDLLAALLLSIAFSLACGWLYLGEALLRAGRDTAAARGALALLVLLGALLLFQRQLPQIRAWTTDKTGLETIDTVAAAPPGSTVMLAWGTRYFAAAAGQLYLGRLGQITLADDQSDLATPFAAGALITPAYTRYHQPPAWWAERLGQPIFPQAAAPGLVRIAPAPHLVLPAAGPLRAVAASVDCAAKRLSLAVSWQAGAEQPRQELSVFVKAYDAAGQLIAQGDQQSPVYGWRPLTGWRAGETIADIYPLAAAPGSVSLIRYGLYRTTAAGNYEDQLAYDFAPQCSSTGET